MTIGVAVLVVLLAIGGYVVYRLWFSEGQQLAKIEAMPFPAEWEAILTEKVPFYKGLNDDALAQFRKKMLRFVHTIKINGGGGVQMTTELLVLTAASAVIPVVKLKGWPYYSLDEVVLVPDNVRNPHDLKSLERSNIQGMVYSPSANHTIFLSAPALLAGFSDAKDSRNVGIHEFAHLVDAADSMIDGVPAVYLPTELIPEWRALMEEEMARIATGETKINPYAATAEPEFFAVMSEAFFENPKRLKVHHNKMYKLLQQVYKAH